MGQKVVKPQTAEAHTGFDLMVERKRARVKQYRVAHRVGITESELSRIENGKKEVDADRVAAIRQAIRDEAAARDESAA